MAGEKEILAISHRNLKAVQECEETTKSKYAKGYFRGKRDAIAHVIALLTEKEGKNG